jgi:hypothetical protein
VDARSSRRLLSQIGRYRRAQHSDRDRPLHRLARASLAYKLGQLRFRELRERAQKELGPKFDIRRLHDEMLDGGTLPLDLLEARTDKWIAQQKSN